MTGRFAVSVRSGTHQERWGEALVEGLKRHGWVRVGERERPAFVTCWGWRGGKRLRQAGHRVLVLERGYLGDRFAWTSLGWDGLNGYATFPESGGPERLALHHPEALRPWRSGDGDLALLLGQVKGDASLVRIDPLWWYDTAAKALLARGWRVAYRQHPVEAERGYPLPILPAGVEVRRGTLAEALRGVAVAVAWNSNALTDCACLGVPVIACDKGAMAWPVAGHGLDAGVLRPDREPWAERLAWCQWSLDELQDGTAWEHVRQCL